jgi:hypothetical protein
MKLSKKETNSKSEYKHYQLANQLFLSELVNTNLF